MKIGEIAQHAHVSRSTIRYYEDRGILPQAVRDCSGYRAYGDIDLARIRLATGARRLGCSLGEIKDLIAMQEEERIPTSHLLELLKDKVAEVGDEIGRLRSVEMELCKLHDLALRLAEAGGENCKGPDARMTE